MNIAKLTVSIGVPLLVGFIGALYTEPAINGWYAELAKPVLNPPNWVFGPMWTALYILMGIAAFLVLRMGLHVSGVRIALLVFIAQLVLNSLWSLAFFGLQNPALALVDIVVLIALILWTITLFARISRTAAWLLVPYLVWVIFATYLNASIVLIN